MSFGAPLVAHGAPVTAYLVEWWDATVPVAPEVVTITLAGAGSGAVRFSLNGSRTDYLPVGLSAGAPSPLYSPTFLGKPHSTQSLSFSLSIQMRCAAPCKPWPRCV